MKRVIPGMLLCLAAIILLNKNQALIGVPAFIVGILLMYGGKWPRR